MMFYVCISSIIILSHLISDARISLFEHFYRSDQRESTSNEKKRIVLSNTYTDDSGTSRMQLRRLLISQIGITIGRSGFAIRVGISSIYTLFLGSDRKDHVKSRCGNTHTALAECQNAQNYNGMKIRQIGEGITSQPLPSSGLFPFHYHFKSFMECLKGPLSRLLLLS